MPKSDQLVHKQLLRLKCQTSYCKNRIFTQRICRMILFTVFGSEANLIAKYLCSMIYSVAAIFLFKSRQIFVCIKSSLDCILFIIECTRQTVFQLFKLARRGNYIFVCFSGKTLVQCKSFLLTLHGALWLKGVTGLPDNFPIQQTHYFAEQSFQFYKTIKLIVERGSYLASQ